MAFFVGIGMFLLGLAVALWGGRHGGQFALDGLARDVTWADVLNTLGWMAVFFGGGLVAYSFGLLPVPG
jgi:hypothetical protein